MNQEHAHRKIVASLGGEAAWACTCGAAKHPGDRRHVQHLPGCRYQLRRQVARKAAQATANRLGAAHYRRLAWMRTAGNPGRR